MRTTLTLDEDIAAKLKTAAAENQASFKETVNQVLRRGFDAMEAQEPPGRFVVRARALEAKPGVSYDNIGELLHLLDSPYPL